MSVSKTTKIEVPILARVEGEGALDLEIENGEIKKCQLRIYEPPRYFEKFLEGRSPNEVIDAVARICGICPLAYQTAAAGAMERVFGIEISPWAKDTRLLMMLGQWVQSHYLHIHLLAAPDFLGYKSAIEMAKDFPNEVVRGVKLQHLGNDIMKLLGGRSVHPNGVKLGGFWHSPKESEVKAFIPRLKEALADAKGVIDLVASLKFPDTTIPFIQVSLRHPSEYPVIANHAVTSRGEEFDVNDWEEHFREFHAPQSTALHSTTLDGEPLLLGPLSRINLNFDRLPKHVQELANATGIKFPSKNMFHSAVARAIEGYWAIERALQLCEAYQYCEAPSEPEKVAAGASWAGVEAPRGIQIDKFEFNAEGKATHIRISAPTSQNLPCMEQDLRIALKNFGLDRPDHEIQLHAEMVIRNYDPCISCSTHFLTLNVTRK